MRQRIHRIGEQRHRAIKRGLLHRRSPVQKGGRNGEKIIKRLPSTRPHCLQRFLTKCPRAMHPNVNVSRKMGLSTTAEKCSNHGFLREVLESCLRLEEWMQISQCGLTTWKDTQRKSMQRYCEVANKKTSSRWDKVSAPCVYDQHQFKKEGGTGNGGRIVKNCSRIGSQMPLFGAAYVNNLARAVAKWTSGRPDIIWSVNKLAKSSHAMDESVRQAPSPSQFVRSQGEQSAATVSRGNYC